MSSKPEEIVLDDVDYSIEMCERTPFRRRRCPIMVTMMDSGITEVDIQRMMEAGMNMVRFKMSTFTRESLIHVLDKMDTATTHICAKHGIADWPLGKCIELKSCIVRTGLLEKQLKGYAVLPDNTEVLITNNTSYYNKCNSSLIYIDDLYLSTDVKVGTEIFLNGDELALVCQDVIDSKTVRCIVKKSGRLVNLATVNIPGTKEARPILNNVDMHRIDFALEHDLDVIIMNFVRSAATIKQLKQYIAKQTAQRPLILSGISTDQDLEVIDEILKESDGLIVSREFLPFQMQMSTFYRLNNVQKWIAAKCQQSGKPVYLSGGVFNKSLESSELCQSEVLDAANALLSGISGIILRNCSNVDLTIDAINVLNDLCCGIEPYVTSKKAFWKLTEQIKMPVNAAEACLMSCVAMANQVKARVIVLPTVTGRTVKAIHSMRPNCLVLAVCNKSRVTRMLYLYRSIVPILCDAVSPEKRIEFAIMYGVQRKWLFYHDVYVTLQRSGDTCSFCDCIRVCTVEISDKPLIQCSEKGEELPPTQYVSNYKIVDKKHK